MLRSFEKNVCPTLIKRDTRCNTGGVRPETCYRRREADLRQKTCYTRRETGDRKRGTADMRQNPKKFVPSGMEMGFLHNF